MRRSSIVRSASKGQSFVELSIVVLLLMLLLAGIAEYGMLLNRYLNLVDGVREAARFTANQNPFCSHTSTDAGCPPDTVPEQYFKWTACRVEEVIAPIKLNAVRADGKPGDDIIISFFAVKNGAIVSRWPPSEGENGWSWASSGDQDAADDCLWNGGAARQQVSKQSTAFIQSKFVVSSPDVSVALVEVFYNYGQTLKAPFYEQVFPDPIPVYTFAVMPVKYEGP